jgi:hypothetical protein
VAFLKFSRDRRGYEHFYLVQPSNRGKARPRVLYWFRTPPNIKVGRSPFDPDIRRALEAQNPDVAFDWEAIVHTPIPPPMEPERWRERRRVERVLRAAEIEEADSIADASEPSSEAEIPAQVVQAIEEPEHASPAVEVGEVSPTVERVATSNLSSSAASATPEGGTPRQGRRRRRRRGRHKPQVPGSGGQVQGSEPESSKSPEPAIQDSGEPGEENLEP